uniref:Uncharacterized protein n=1 Tax=Anguilla anguilla TaxID=7936 RepID=A0A0E9T542_ANGAN
MCKILFLLFQSFWSLEHFQFYNISSRHATLA